MQIFIFLILLFIAGSLFIIICRKKNNSADSVKMTSGNKNFALLGNLFWKVFNTSVQSIFLLQDFKIVDCNEAGLQLFGGRKDEVVGKAPFELSPAIQPDGSSSEIKGNEILNRIFEEGVVNFEFQHRKINGEVFLTEISATSFEFEGVNYVAATLRDITNYRKQEAELQNYRLRLEQMVEEKTKELESSNQELQTINEELDASNEELYAANEELQSTNEELDNANASLSKEINEHKKTQEEREKYRTQLESLLKEKTDRLAQISEWFNEVYSNSSEAITFMDVVDDGRKIKVFDMNPVSKKLFRIAEDKEVQGLSINDLLPEIKIDSFKKNLLPKVLTGTSVSFIEGMDTGNGYWNSTIYPIKDQTGKVRRIAAFSRNITAEYEREKMTAILQSAIDSWPFEFWARDINGREILQNLASREKAGNLINTKLTDIDLSTEKRRQVNELVKRVLKGEHLSIENESLEKGKPRYVVYKLSPIIEKGNVIGYTGIAIDITDQKQAEEKIRISEEKYRLLAENIDDVIWKFDVNKWRYTYFSPSIYKLTGYTVEEALELIPEEFIIPEAFDDFKVTFLDWLSQYDDAVPRSKTHTFEFPMRHKKGKLVWVEVNATLVYKDHVKEVLATSRSIEGRKATEMALRQSEERYDLITNLSGYVVYDYDIKTKNVIWAGAVTDLLGYTVDELTEKGYDGLVNLVNPEDLKHMVHLSQESKNSIKSTITQYRILTKNNGYIWIESNAFLFTDSENKPYRWLGIMKDITEQLKTQSLIKESEEKLRTIFNTSKDGIVVIDKDMMVVDINPSALSRSGYQFDEVAGKNIFGFLLKENVPESIRYLNSMWSGSSIRNFETDILIKNNGFFPVEISASAMHLSKKEVLLLLIRDISERKKHEKELLQSVINTEEKERVNFSQELHDGLGPLLSAAKMYVEWLAEPDSTMEQNKIIPDIKKLLEESARTVKDISFKLSPHILQNYGLMESLNAYAEKVEKAGKTHIAIQASGIGRFDEIAETIVYRVICECINNTLKHAKAQNINIKIEIADSLLVVNYSDDGTGFDIEKAMNERKGIGLLNMQSRLKSINGVFLIQSTSGKGINVLINVPVTVK